MGNESAILAKCGTIAQLLKAIGQQNVKEGAEPANIVTTHRKDSKQYRDFRTPLGTTNTRHFQDVGSRYA
jgi:hypothetical protein